MKNEELIEKSCKPCKQGTPSLKEDEIRNLQKSLHVEWNVINNHHLTREFGFKNFKEALDFTNKVGQLAENEGHHPDILLSWGKVIVTIWTHKINGLSDNDFILAAKIDELTK